MKKIFYAALFATAVVFSGCNTLKSLAGLSEADAANAIREALIIGTNNGAGLLGQKGSFSRDVLLGAILPREVQSVVQTLDRLGLAKEFNRFANTLDDCAIESVKRSTPIFISGIRQMSIRDAIGIVKNGGTAATDYLRRTVGDTLRSAVTPVMRTALDQYRIEQQWEKLVNPVRLVLGNKAGLNLNLDNILAVIITNEMFNKIQQQEIAIRTNAQARTTSTLQRVFGRDWNNAANR
ncbi:MAG: hypothetical protein NVSMB63_06650 [Sediminibacterium sp.]